MLGHDESRELSHCRTVGDVELMSAHPYLVRPQEICCARDSGFVDVSEREMTPASRERHRDGPPDAIARARDDGRSTCEAHLPNYG
jgi:hypothetical protein